MGRRVAWCVLLALPSSCGASTPAATSTQAAVIVTTTAAVLHVAGGGCKIAGCTAGLACNPVTELCEPIPCGASGCPVGTRCEVDRCVAR